MYCDWYHMELFAVVDVDIAVVDQTNSESHIDTDFVDIRLVDSVVPILAIAVRWILSASVDVDN